MRLVVLICVFVASVLASPKERLSEAENDTLSTTVNTNDEEERKSYKGSQLWKIKSIKQTSMEVLNQFRENNDISMWGGNATNLDILVRSSSLETVGDTLLKANISYDIIIQDLQKAIDEENPIDELDLDDRKGYRLTWQSYHRLQDIHEYLEYMAQTYPSLCSVQNIGTSVNGKIIKMLKISNGVSGNRAVWIDGGIHAREWISPATVTYIINQIVLNYENEPKYIQNTDWYIVPVLNPDGYEYTHTTDRLWRKNRARAGFCGGTDLNRNFGYKWGGRGSSKNPCAETYGGSGPFSEPETAAVQKFMIANRNKNWKAYLSFHSYGQYILFPWGYDRVVPSDYKDLEIVGRKAAEAIRLVNGLSYTVGPAGNTLYPAAGGSDDWAKGAMKIKYAYTIELRDNGRYGFVLPSTYIQPTAKEAYAALKAISESIQYS